MYIRRTSIKSRNDGSQYFTYRLVESKRTGKGVRQHTLLNLGADFALPREQWPDLTKRIEGVFPVSQCDTIGCARYNPPFIPTIERRMADGLQKTTKPERG